MELVLEALVIEALLLAVKYAVGQVVEWYQVRTIAGSLTAA